VVVRSWPDLALERQLWNAGVGCLAGLDEAGRGAWAGPLLAGAVILPPDWPEVGRLLAGVRDSKQMTPRQRARWAEEIRKVATAVGLGQATPEEVDRLGPLGASRLAMERALADLWLSPDHLLIDHLRLPEVMLPQTALPQGDAQVLSIAAASVMAKVTRDEAMVRLEAEYPGYGFSRHKGYGTAEHRAALDRLGPCPIHRHSYAPVAACLVEASPGEVAAKAAT
jgi:ribonuclease HII